MNSKSGSVAVACMLMTVGMAFAQENGQPASDVLMQLDIWGNPTPRGGVTNNGPNAHSVW